MSMTEPEAALLEAPESFEIFPWDENFETGIAKVDAQHRHLVHLLNCLADQFVNGADELAMTRILAELSDYARYHFVTEESIWETELAGSKDFDQHCALHAQFFDKIESLTQSGMDFENLLEELFGFLTQWLAFHIIDQDKRLALTLQGLSQGLSLQAAKHQAHEVMSGTLSILINTVLKMYKQLSSRTVDLMREKAARLKAEKALQTSQACWQLISDSDGDMIWDWTLSPAEQELTQTQLVDTLLERHYEQGELHPDDRAEFLQGFTKHLSGQASYFTAQFRYRRQTGGWQWLKTRGQVVERGPGLVPRRILGVVSDITDRLEYQQRLERAAYYDALTGLPNRNHLMERLAQRLSSSSPMSSLTLFFLDLDDLKSFNQAEGNDQGDRLLISLAQHWQALTSEGDQLVRLAGDEFVMVCEGLSPADDHEKIKQLFAALERVQQAWPDAPRVTVSAGLVRYQPDTGSSGAEALLRHASQAMYQAKLQGKNSFQYFDLQQNARLKSRHKQLVRLESALQGDELRLYYQPKIRLSDGEVVGFEALIRWQHPEQGLLLPGQFLPWIDNHPLSVNLGDWVLTQALDQLQTWQRQGHEYQVSVNVSPLQFQHPDFVPRLQALLGSYSNLRPEQLELELLESTALREFNQAREVMQSCRSLGVSLSLDDFGTGYSSLAYLQNLPAQTIKVDRSFVQKIDQDKSNLSLLSGLQGLAKSFQLTCLAEGVETTHQLQALTALGYDQVQGFLVARPMPASALPAWIEAWSQQRLQGCCDAI